MGIYDYRDGSHPGQFKGFRVAVTIDGVAHQHYFTADERAEAYAKLEELLTLQAKALVRKRKRDSIAAIPNNYVADKYQNPRRTAVKGLALKFNEGRHCKPLLHYPAIIVSNTNEQGHRLYTSRGITPRQRTLPQAWRECCKMLATHRGLKRIPSRWLRDMPHPDQFKALAKFYNIRSEDMPPGIMEFIYSTATTSK